jgi:GNAT superfamily N-acetyltransferase
MDLTAARTDADFAEARTLFQEYAAQLGVDLCFQGFNAELERLPTMYGPPAGSLLLARDEAGAVLGCVGLRQLASDPQACEMKRLYVRDAARGRGLGRALATACIDAARELGYRRLVLDTLGQMSEARALYATLGFSDIGAYYANPNADVKYLELTL